MYNVIGQYRNSGKIEFWVIKVTIYYHFSCIKTKLLQSVKEISCKYTSSSEKALLVNLGQVKIVKKIRTFVTIVIRSQITVVGLLYLFISSATLQDMKTLSLKKNEKSNGSDFSIVQNTKIKLATLRAIMDEINVSEEILVSRQSNNPYYCGDKFLKNIMGKLMGRKRGICIKCFANRYISLTIYLKTLRYGRSIPNRVVDDFAAQFKLHFSY